MAVLPTAREAVVVDLARLLREPGRLPSPGRVALRVSVFLIRWSRRLADCADAADRAARNDAGAAATAARDRAIHRRFLAGPR